MEEHASTQAKTGVDTTKQPQEPASAPAVPPVPPGPAVDPDAAVAAPKPKRGGHLHQIDLVRLVTFAAVIFDHVILGLMSAGAVAAGGIGLLCRYTRYSFFALTGFVQTYQYRNRELKPVEYWRRRYKLIGLPFLMWSLFYWAYTRYRRGGISNVVDNFTSLDALGTAQPGQTQAQERHPFHQRMLASGDVDDGGAAFGIHQNSRQPQEGSNGQAAQHRQNGDVADGQFPGDLVSAVGHAPPQGHAGVITSAGCGSSPMV